MLRLQDNPALKLVALAAVVAMLILGHWAYLLAFRVSPYRLGNGFFLVERRVLLFAAVTLVIGGGYLLLDHVMAWLDLSLERRRHVFRALSGLVLLLLFFLKVASGGSLSSMVVFSFGTTPVTTRDMDFLLMGAFLLSMTLNCLAALGLVEFQPRQRRLD